MDMYPDNMNQYRLIMIALVSEDFAFKMYGYMPIFSLLLLQRERTFMTYHLFPWIMKPLQERNEKEITFRRAKFFPGNNET